MSASPADTRISKSPAASPPTEAEAKLECRACKDTTCAAPLIDGSPDEAVACGCGCAGDAVHINCALKAHFMPSDEEGNSPHDLLRVCEVCGTLFSPEVRLKIAQQLTLLVADEEDESLEKLEIAVRLCFELISVGKLEQSKALIVDVMTKVRRVVEVDDECGQELLYNALAAMAAVLAAMDDDAAALPVLEEQVALLRRIYMEKPFRFTTICNLAVCKATLGDFAGAEPLMIEVVDGLRRIRGADDEQTLHSVGNLAKLYGATGKFTLERPLREDLLERSRRVFGAQADETVVAACSLGEVLVSLQDLRAEAAYQEAYDISVAKYNEQHPVVQQLKQNLANLAQIRQRQERIPTAAEVLQSHPDAAAAIQRDPIGAAAFMQEVLRETIEEHGEDHQNVRRAAVLLHAARAMAAQVMVQQMLGGLLGGALGAGGLQIQVELPAGLAQGQDPDDDDDGPTVTSPGSATSSSGSDSSDETVDAGTKRGQDGAAVAQEGGAEADAEAEAEVVTDTRTAKRTRRE
jgi:hypothetical protein